MKIKRLLVGALAAGLMLSACGQKGEDIHYDEEYDITVWVSEVDGMDTLTKKQIEDYGKEAKIKYNVTIEKQSESNAATKMITDVTNGADIYCFAQDQTMRLVKAGALSEIVGNGAKAIREQNDADSVAAVTFNNSIYAYPMTSDNGYFLYYDKTVISDDIVGSFERILKACEDADKTFSFEGDTSGWYLASWFFGAGCKSEWTVTDDGDFTAVDDDFNSAKGLIAAKAYYAFSQSKAYLSSSDAGDFSKGSAALVSGTWAYNTVKGALGNNMGVAELPSYTDALGVKHHLGSFKGCKLMGVKPQSDPKKAVALNKLAVYLTGEKAQLERFEAVAWGPSNKEAQKNEKVLANPALTAVRAQSPYAVSQGQIHGSWWGIATTLATAIKNSDGSDLALAAALKTYDDSEQQLFSLDKNAWLLVGAWNGWDNADSTMIAKEVSTGVFEITVEVGEDLDYKGGRFVHPGEWGTDFGGTIVDTESQALIDVASSTSGDHNIVFLAGGTYKLTLDTSVPSIHIVKLA